MKGFADSNQVDNQISNEKESGGGNYQGTIFRFPLRNQTQAKQSEFRKTETTIQSIWVLLKQLIDSGVDSLLLLQHLSHLKVFRWKEGDPKPTLYYTLELACVGSTSDQNSNNNQGGQHQISSSPSSASSLSPFRKISKDMINDGLGTSSPTLLDKHRYELHDWTRTQLKTWSKENRKDWRDESASLALTEQLRKVGQSSAPRRTIRVKAIMTYGGGTSGGASGGSGGTVGYYVEEEWWMRYGLGRGSSWSMATSEEAKDAEHALWPAVTVAARLWSCMHNR
jgi:hypothetical protein